MGCVRDWGDFVRFGINEVVAMVRGGDLVGPSRDENCIGDCKSPSTFCGGHTRNILPQINVR